MKSYRIAEAVYEPRLAGREFGIDELTATGISAAEIDSYVWDESGYRPKAYAAVWKTETGLRVLLCAKEDTIACEEKRFGGAVYRDSCLEFFLAPCPKSDARYLNFEVNAIGTMHLAVGAGRHDRRVLTVMPEGIEVEHSKHRGAWWAVSYRIPYVFLNEVFGRQPEAVMRGNFYKCDETIHPHFGTWNAVTAEQPDFHRPECFGQLIL